MTLTDFLLPAENIRFSSKSIIEFGDKRYRVFVTDKRLILYAQRGMLSKSDDIVSEKLDGLYGIKYYETGFLLRTAIISIQGATKFDLKGSISELKPLYNSLQATLNKR